MKGKLPKVKIKKLTKGYLAFLSVRDWCLNNHLPEPIPEYRFAWDTHHREWRFDCCWPCHRLALEFNGGNWVKGAHARGSQMIKDYEKYAHTAILRWHLMLTSYDQFNSGETYKWIKEFFSEREPINGQKNNH